MKNLMDVAVAISSCKVVYPVNGIVLAEGAKDPCAFIDQMHGFVYADLYRCFDLKAGIVSNLIEQGLDRFKNLETQTEEDAEEALYSAVRAVVTRAFLEGYKAGFECLDNMSDPVLFDDDEIPQAAQAAAGVGGACK